MKRIRITFNTPIDEIVDIIHNGDRFYNSTASFTGRPVTPMEAVRITGNTDPAFLTVESRFALMMDEPDYIITLMDIPVAWHSTVRGIESKALPPNPEKHTWVNGEVTDRKFLKRHSRALDISYQIVLTLNRELDNEPANNR